MSTKKINKTKSIVRSIKGEVWKDMVGYKGYYQVSNKGRFKGLDRIIKRIDGTNFSVKGILRVMNTDSRGHLTFPVSKDGKSSNKRIHREVAKLFVPNPCNFPDVRNINGNKMDNRDENLEWFDSREIIEGKKNEILKQERERKRQEYKISMANKIKKFALERGGLCLSEKYISIAHKLKFKCKNGHVWDAIPSTILKRGTWCSMCKATIGEDICRYILQEAFKTSFDRVRPDWLLNKSGYRLELDGYSEKLKIAFEYQGEQHYKAIKFYGNIENRFENQLQRDKIKRDKCKANGVVLLVFPFFRKMLTDEILCVISKELVKNNIDTEILNGMDINKFYFDKPHNKNHEDILKIVKVRGGELLTTINFLNDYAKFKCENGHTFKTTGLIVKSGRWCRFCGYKRGSSKRKKSIDEAHELAKIHNGECLSEKYLGSKKRHIFKCKNGHIFKRYINGLRLHGDKNWCLRCNKE